MEEESDGARFLVWLPSRGGILLLCGRKRVLPVPSSQSWWPSIGPLWEGRPRESDDLQLCLGFRSEVWAVFCVQPTACGFVYTLCACMCVLFWFQPCAHVRWCCLPSELSRQLGNTLFVLESFVSHYRSHAHLLGLLCACASSLSLLCVCPCLSAVRRSRVGSMCLRRVLHWGVWQHGGGLTEPSQVGVQCLCCPALSRWPRVAVHHLKRSQCQMLNVSSFS